jgi:hypothetical protein
LHIENVFEKGFSAREGIFTGKISTFVPFSYACQE